MGEYEVIVRGMAVNEQKCLMSILERFELQVKSKGWGRLVTLDHFYETYNAMPKTIDAIEKSGIVNAVEIYKRGTTPNEPVKIYDSRDTVTRRFPNARFAVLEGRVEDGKTITSPGDKEIKEYLNSELRTEEERSIFERVIELKVGKRKNDYIHED